jgi:hypothetical protein
MDTQKLREQLEELHAELQQGESLNETDRYLLQNLAGEIREALARGDEQTEHYSGLGERFKESVAQLEASHPKATLLMRQVIDQLGFMGI